MTPAAQRADSAAPRHKGAAQRPVAAALTRLTAVALLAVMFAFAKLAEARGVSLVELIFYRQAAAVPMMAAIALAGGGLATLRTSRPAAHAFRMVLGLTGMMFNFLAMFLLPLADATVIGFSVPLLATLLAALLLKEPTGLWRWSAVLIGLAGVILVVQPSSATLSSPGTLIALAGALATSAVTIQIRNLAATESATTIVFWFTFSSLLPLGLLMPWFADWHDGTGWLLIAGVGISGALGQLALTQSLRLGPVAAVLPMDYSALLFAAALGWLLLGEVPSTAALIGAPVIIASGLVILWREHVLQKAILAADNPLP